MEWTSSCEAEIGNADCRSLWLNTKLYLEFTGHQLFLLQGHTGMSFTRSGAEGLKVGKRSCRLYRCGSIGGLAGEELDD